MKNALSLSLKQSICRANITCLGRLSITKWRKLPFFDALFEMICIGYRFGFQLKSVWLAECEKQRKNKIILKPYFFKNQTITDLIQMLMCSKEAETTK